jgi:hypothetical protein
VCRVVYQESYPDDTALQFLSQAGIDVLQLTEKI